MNKRSIVSCTLFAACAGLLTLGACRHQASKEPAGPPPEPLAYQPVEYFEINCARCHGSYGSSYGEAFGDGLGDHELHEYVDEMAAGPGMAPLEGAELEAQVAFHRSMIDGRPFIAWTGFNQETLTGELSDGASLEASFGGETLNASANGAQWTVQTPDGFNPQTDLAQVELTAMRGEKQTRLRLNESPFSHAAPLESNAH